MRDEAGVVAKFGVPPASIPDYLALVGDAADGYPGLPGWGAKSSGGRAREVRPPRVDSRRLADVERERGEPGASGAHARARARPRVPVSDAGDAAHRHALFESVDELKWDGPTPAFAALAARLEVRHLAA